MWKLAHGSLVHCSVLDERSHIVKNIYIYIYIYHRDDRRHLHVTSALKLHWKPVFAAFCLVLHTIETLTNDGSSCLWASGGLYFTSLPARVSSICDDNRASLHICHGGGGWGDLFFFFSFSFLQSGRCTFFVCILFKIPRVKNSTRSRLETLVPTETSPTSFVFRLPLTCSLSVGTLYNTIITITRFCFVFFG